jgi:hypothetical protein
MGRYIVGKYRSRGGGIRISMIDLKYGDRILHSFDNNTSFEEILEWVKETYTRPNDMIFSNRDLWKLSSNKRKIYHETKTSYSEFNLEGR